ncbi:MULTISPECIES: 30S ribosome-binding factor RbfA [Methylomonas]|uniref:Ribosome-binding factor A n=2 Tax=Methylomonas TaxID=416 RepID=A0A126T812_9GAMM|nr:MULTISPECIES: 30S ribosome-binding factor RbfA [Methylomonas]AMK78229.1 ribosome-binding factor A [Methylomonas denitrificans]OAI03947.1 ribosome-binding factor A [Methylomonas methanica]TCV87743.1 ribosome-binding factor A [Methylomonas methanica]
MAREFGRSQRVASEMQKELASILQRDVDDSRLGFVTINDVELSKDLAVAKIFVTVLDAQDDAAKRANVKVLNEISPFIRHELAKRMRLRHISELHFYYDHSFDTGMRVAELLGDLHHDEGHDASAAPEDVVDKSQQDD